MYAITYAIFNELRATKGYCNWESDCLEDRASSRARGEKYIVRTMVLHRLRLIERIRMDHGLSRC